MRRLIVALVLVIGCGSNEAAGPLGSPDAAAPKDTGSPGDQLLGTWLYEISSNAAVRLKFDGANFEQDVISLLTDGSYGMSINQGTYTVAGDTISLRLKSSSCQGVEPIPSNTSSWTFTRDGTALSINNGKKYTTYQLKTTPPTGTGSAVIGCFKSDDTFVAHAAAPVP
jgi:hypothetical protein